MLPTTPVKAAWALLLLVASLSSLPVAAQQPAPPQSERVFQDELDLQANANFVQGSGARAFGMGGAFLARADDATAASWNPAGLSYLRAPELSFVYLDSSFKGRKRARGVDLARRPVELDTRDDRTSGFPDFMAFTWPWEAGETSGAVQISYQRLIPFASSRTITDTTTFTSTNQEFTETRTVESRGGFDVLALGTGVRVSRRLRVGVTLNHWFHGYRQTILKPQQFAPSRQESSFDMAGWNVHLGAIASPIESLNFGIVFKGGFTPNADLSRVRYDSFPATPSGAPAKTNFNLYARHDLKLDLPWAIGLGASWRPRSNLTLSVDYTRTNWSESRIRNFFALARANPTGALEYPSPAPPASGDFCGVYGPDDPPPAPNVTPCSPVLPYPTLDSSVRQGDTDQIRGGIEYVILKSRLKWPVRAGYFRDGQFFRSLDGDAPTFDGLTLGTGLILGNVLLDVAYVYESGRYTDRNVVLEELEPGDPGPARVLRGPGDNDVKSHKIYASVIYRFSRRP